jgi:hypothetical protein
MQCQKKKRDGNQCGARARAGHKYCALHAEPGKAGRRTQSLLAPTQ